MKHCQLSITHFPRGVDAINKLNDFRNVCFANTRLAMQVYYKLIVQG